MASLPPEDPRLGQLRDLILQLLPEPARASLPPGVADRLGAHVSYQFHITHGEYLGAERILYGTIEGGALDGRKVISRIPSTHSAGLVDDSVHAFAVAEGDLKFFDPKTEKRTKSGRLPA